MSDEKKPGLIIDEDWKSQVERERAAASEPKPAATEAAAPKPAGESAARAARGQLPPPTLGILISTLATQALFALGQLPGIEDKPGPIDLEQAQHFIDLLAMLETKTAGNRTDEESKLLDGALYELRMIFVQVKK